MHSAPATHGSIPLASHPPGLAGNGMVPTGAVQYSSHSAEPRGLSDLSGFVSAGMMATSAGLLRSDSGVPVNSAPVDSSASMAPPSRFPMHASSQPAQSDIGLMGFDASPGLASLGSGVAGIWGSEASVGDTGAGSIGFGLVNADDLNADDDEQNGACENEGEDGEMVANGAISSLFQ